MGCARDIASWLTHRHPQKLIFVVLLRQMPLYENVKGRMVVYWLGNIGCGAGPLILSWINEICSGDTEKRALLVAMANDLAYVVQAIVRFPQPVPILAKLTIHI